MQLQHFNKNLLLRRHMEPLGCLLPYNKDMPDIKQTRNKNNMHGRI